MWDRYGDSEMRVNPFLSNVCAMRIGSYRKDQCTAAGLCKFIAHCDQHYIEDTGDWDYPKPERLTHLDDGPKLVPKKGGIYETDVQILPFCD